MQKANLEFRRAVQQSGTRIWAVAEFLGISDSTMTRMLRRELSAEDKARFMDAVDQLARKHAIKELK